METPETGEDRSSRRGRQARSGLVAAGAAFGMTLAGLGIAAAQTDTSTTTTPPTTGAPDAQQAPALKPGGRHHGRGLGIGIHGEFTTRAPGGGYQTIATQVGEVSEVSRSSLTVRSEDGYSRTYAVDDNTLVNAGNDGIADVRQGDQVHVTAVVRDGRASAVSVDDATRVRELRGRWMPPPPARTPDGSGPSGGGS